MQRILVLDVAANEGGALSVLNEYHKQLRQDTQNTYVFCVSLPELEETDNLKVLRFPWVKRSWLHRLWFEYVTVKRLMRQEKIDRVFSLQNTAVGGTRCPQTIYLHQPLPFCGISFSLFRHPKFWVYQHLIGPHIFRSLRRAETVIVQTKWMKKAACEKAGISPDKVVLEAPEISAVPAKPYNGANWRRTFFYPASPYVYKNHELILQAVEQLVAAGETDFSVKFTLTAEQLPVLSKYPKAAPHIQLCGQMPREAVMEEYAASVLLFPSYIETFGLPLLEARMTGAPILASDCPFSQEILEGYGPVQFFDPFSAEQLAVQMKELLQTACERI